ncbi:MAG TPA: hypothetical protein PLU10_07200 [Chitinophagaceae bacterium]|nr:hypothetical protein [Chitinophagaceae bacterium]
METQESAKMPIDQYLNVMGTTHRVEYTQKVDEIYKVIQQRRRNSMSKSKVVGIAASLFVLISINVILLVQNNKAQHPKAAQQIVRVLHLETNNDIYHE